MKVLASYDVEEKLDGKDATVTMVEVTFGPQQAELHIAILGRRSCMSSKATYELGIDDKPTKIYKAGETFQEPSGCLHRVSRNPAQLEIPSWLRLSFILVRGGHSHSGKPLTSSGG